MKSPDIPTCPRCGTPIPPGATEQLCPACLLSGAVSGNETEPVPSGRSSIPREPAEFPSAFGGYQLLRLLGRGGMGAVYEAEERATGRRVALKMLGQQLDSPDMRQRFLREGRLAARVNHPNSLYVFGSEEIEGLPVITMEIAGSGTLKDKLEQRGPLPVAEAVDAILDVIDGLESAFAVGVLHRDIKPSNCFVSPDGAVKVGDFGLSVSTLAKSDTFITATGGILGTPAYAPPEQLRGDELDVRADIYSVGATLFTLLTNRAPFEGDNAVQVVANAVNQEARPLTELRHDVPPGLERAVARCLAKEPDRRYADYPALRNALLPFSSKEPEPASMKARAAAGWIDYLIAFLVPYVILMLWVGGAEFHLQPLIDRSLYSARYYFMFLGFGFLYFALFEGIWGAGLGKGLKGLRVVCANGRPPGIGRALIRVVIPILAIEGVRIPFLLATIAPADLNAVTGTQVWLYIGASNVCAWIPLLFGLGARRDNGFATLWDLLSGTRVRLKQKGSVRPRVEPAAWPEPLGERGDSLGPYRILEALVPEAWIVATDPVLRRSVWLLKRNAGELSPARRNLARQGRLRWLQKVQTVEATWDAFEATPGVPFSSRVEGGRCVPWSTLRHWLHDLASELWEATRDHTLPPELSLDHVWITASGHAVLLDEPWPVAPLPSERIPVGDLAGQQRFLDAIARCTESTSLPLHARPALQNLKDGRYEKLSFLTGTLRGLLDKPTEVSRGIRAGSVFMLPLYVWILVFVGYYRGEGARSSDHPLGATLMISALVVLAAIALIQLLEYPFRSTASHSIFRLAVVTAGGRPAGMSTLLARWCIVWLPLFLPVLLMALAKPALGVSAAYSFALVVLLLWMGAAVYAVAHPNRGLHDRLVGTWVVRR